MISVSHSTHSYLLLLIYYIQTAYMCMYYLSLSLSFSWAPDRYILLPRRHLCLDVKVNMVRNKLLISSLICSSTSFIHLKNWYHHLPNYSGLKYGNRSWVLNFPCPKFVPHPTRATSLARPVDSSSRQDAQPAHSLVMYYYHLSPGHRHL